MDVKCFLIVIALIIVAMFISIVPNPYPDNTDNISSIIVIDKDPNGHITGYIKKGYNKIDINNRILYNDNRIIIFGGKWYG